MSAQKAIEEVIHTFLARNEHIRREDIAISMDYKFYHDFILCLHEHGYSYLLHKGHFMGIRIYRAHMTGGGQFRYTIGVMESQ